MQTVIALFNRFEAARNAFETLQQADFSTAELNCIAADPTSRQRQNEADSGEQRAAAAGLPAETVALSLPGIGAVIAAGPIITALLTAPGGATATGIVAELVKRGVPEQPAGVVLEGVRRGGALLTATVEDELAGKAAALMNTFGPVDLEKMAAQWLDLEATLPSSGQLTGSFPPALMKPNEPQNIPLEPEPSSVNVQETAVQPATRSLADEILALGPQPFIEWSLEINETVETAEVQVQARVVEEARVHKSVESQQVTVRDTVRRQVVDIERSDDGDREGGR